MHFFFSFLLADCRFTLPRLPPGSLSARPCSLLLRGVNPLSLACLTVSLKCATFGETVQEMALTLAAHFGGAIRPIMDLQTFKTVALCPYGPPSFFHTLLYMLYYFLSLA